MKKLSLLTLPFFTLFLTGVLSASGQTPVFDWGYLAPGVTQTNPVVIQAWPVANAWITFNLTNTVYVVTTTNTPNSNGYWSASLYPTTYRKTIPALNAVMYFTVPNTTSSVSVAQCATAIAAAGSSLNSYQLITNWLGYAPAPATPSGIIAALQFTPVTNSYAAITNVVGFIPATNGGALAYSQLPFTPPTNSFSALTNILGFVPATNPPVNWTTNIQFVGPNTTNTLYITNSQPQRMSTP